MKIRIHLEITVNDESALRDAAQSKGLQNGMAKDWADGHLDPSLTSLETCVLVLLGPGGFPPGCTLRTL